MKILRIVTLLTLALTLLSVHPAAAFSTAGNSSLVGPDLEDFPAGVSPLTGLPVSNPENLKLPAVLVSLSNFPPSVRPQTGLSFAPQVYEVYITEGMTRLLTVFYGDLPGDAGTSGPSATATPGSAGGSGSSSSGSGGSAQLGAIENPGDMVSGVRSGREAYVPIINAFPNGCLVAASKSASVNVNICRNVYGRNPNDINSAGLTFDQIKALAEANLKPNRTINYSGNAFSSEVPAGGQAASQINVFYAWLNQSQWKYDEALGSYLRNEDFGVAEKAGQFQPALDRLTGEQVDFENVVVLFVEHTARRPTIIDLEMGVGTQGRAIVFRNGQVYKNLKWSMLNEDYEKSTGLARPLRLKNADGTPFALAPGHTWFYLATTNSAVWQLDAANGIWKYRYYAPPGSL